jgi:predicted MFS family arabinose efflux permease
LATTIAAPLGSFLGRYIGWRGAFFAVVPLAAITLAWQFATLPSLPPKIPSRTRSALGLLGNRQARRGIAAVTLFFMGQFALFTYLRPFLEGRPARPYGGLFDLFCTCRRQSSPRS